MFTKQGARDALSSMFSNCYLGFSTTEPNESGGNVTEPSAAAGYARIHLASSASGSEVFAVAFNDRVMTNTENIYAPEPKGDWGKLTHFAIYSSQTATVPRYVGELYDDNGDLGVTVKDGYIFFLRTGELRISLDEFAASEEEKA